MRRFLSLFALLLGVALIPASCTMPDSRSESTAKSPYPKVVETGHGTPMLQDGDSGWDNATRGTGYRD
ncbi:MAG: hypothetical protein ACYTEP_00665 [Planctomycetota bacterium]|jgi:hypothetical protein